MTLNEVTNSVYNLSVAGYFNGEKHSREWLHNYIKTFTRSIGKSYIFEISMPDGRWFMSVVQYAAGEYDYYIPDTRDQERLLKQKLIANVSK